MKIVPRLLAGALALTTGHLWAASGAEDSIGTPAPSADTLQAMIDTPDKGIPEEALKNAKMRAPDSTLKFLNAISEAA